MMGERLRILYATDGSTGASDALDLVLGSLRPSALHVEVLAVMPRQLGWPLRTPNELRRSVDLGRAAGGDLLVRTRRLIRESGASVSVHLVEGHPAEAIVETSERLRPDLVVVGARGLSGPEKRSAGSVSAKVARYAASSVLVAHDRGPIRRVLVGYDGSSEANAALAFLDGLPLRERVRVVVATVYDVVTPLLSAIAPTMLAEAEAALREDLAEAYQAAEAIAQTAARRTARPGLETSVRVVRGSPREQLEALATTLQADVVAVGCRGFSGVRRFALGSTSAALIADPPASLMIVRRADVPTGR